MFPKTQTTDNDNDQILLKLYYIEDITRWREDMNFTFEWQNNILLRENKIHIFKPLCNVLLII